MVITSFSQKNAFCLLFSIFYCSRLKYRRAAYLKRSSTERKSMDPHLASCFCSPGQMVFQQGLCFTDYGRQHRSSYGATFLRSSNFPDCLDFQWYIEFSSSSPHYIYVKTPNEIKKSPSATFTVKIGQHAPIIIEWSADCNQSQSKLLPNDSSYIQLMNDYTLSVNVTLSVSLTGKYSKLAQKRINSFEEQFKNLFYDELASDVTLLPNNGQFNAHWAVLAARSPFFSAMLKSDYKETQENKIELDVTYETCKKMLEFIYSNQVVIDNEADGQALLKAGDVYLIDGLKDAAENFLCSCVTAENALDFLLLSHQHVAGTLKIIVLDKIVEDLKSITGNPGFSDLLKCADLVAELFTHASSKISS